MSALQKLAWFNLVVVAAAGVLFLAALPWVGMARAVNLLAVLSVGWLGLPLFTRDRRDLKGKVLLDERETAIDRLGYLGGFVASLMFLTATCLGTWAVFHARNQDQISVDVLPLILWGVTATFFLGQGATLLRQLGWRSEDA